MAVSPQLVLQPQCLVPQVALLLRQPAHEARQLGVLTQQALRQEVRRTAAQGTSCDRSQTLVLDE